MIDLYDWPTPNGHEITMFLEEAGLDPPEPGGFGLLERNQLTLWFEPRS